MGFETTTEAQHNAVYKSISALAVPHASFINHVSTKYYRVLGGLSAYSCSRSTKKMKKTKKKNKNKIRQNLK